MTHREFESSLLSQPFKIYIYAMIRCHKSLCTKIMWSIQLYDDAMKITHEITPKKKELNLLICINIKKRNTNYIVQQYVVNTRTFTI